ncbi:MAG: hypothetical protein SVU88_03865 [Candidatus Nanohaloarchaea archaeon]|nr:hypothetical protein [Candidatus Nanohaloarchaea archaeon]
MDDTVEPWLDDAFGERWRSLARSDDDDADLPDVPVEDAADRGDRPRELAVVERDLPGHLFGFTRRDSSHVVVNRRLYRVDKERTVRHEKTHHRHPDDEMTIRYINGDPDVRNTLSFRGNRPERLGTGSRGISRTGGTAAYGEDGRSRYGAATDTYL